MTLHILSSLRVLASQQESCYAFLKNGGIAWASKVRKLKPGSAAARKELADLHPMSGPMGRSCADVALMMDAMQGDEGWGIPVRGDSRDSASEVTA